MATTYDEMGDEANGHAKRLTASKRMRIVVRPVLLCTDVAERTGAKGNHKERPVVDVEPGSGKSGMSLELFRNHNRPYLYVAERARPQDSEMPEKDLPNNAQPACHNLSPLPPTSGVHTRRS